MEKRFVCFTCYKSHPELKGVSEQEFRTGKGLCREANCIHKGEVLEAADYCEPCSKLFPFGTHSH